MEYEVRFGRKHNDLLSATIVFGVINDEYEGEEYVLTNKGEVFNVLNTVVKVIEMFIEEHPNVRSYEFSGEPTDKEIDDIKTSTKRIRVYVRFVERIFDNHWKIQMTGNKILVNRIK